MPRPLQPGRDSLHRDVRLDVGIIVDARQAEAEELEELRPVAGNVRQGAEIFGRDLGPDLSDLRLNFRLHLQVIDPDASGLVELQATAEKTPFDDAQLSQLLETARCGIAELVAIQKQAIGS